MPASTARSLEQVASLLSAYRVVDLSTDISSCDDMRDPGDAGLEHYLSVGRSAIDCIARAMVLGGMTEARNVLDLPCGGGRVTRHLRVFLSEATLFVGDIDPVKVDAVCTQFSAYPIDAGNFRGPPQRRFDLIWVGSSLTHLDENAVRSALRWFADALAVDGLAVVTLHGRRHLDRMSVSGFPTERLMTIEKGWYSGGFG